MLHHMLIVTSQLRHIQENIPNDAIESSHCDIFIVTFVITLISYITVS